MTSMNSDIYQENALAQGDALSLRSGSISSDDAHLDPSIAYQRSLFKHTNSQYLRAKDRLAKQSLRRSRGGNTTQQQATDATTLSKASSNESALSNGSNLSSH